MKIAFHLSDGETYHYEQESNEEARSLLENLKPTKVFSQAQIVLQGNTSLSGFACRNVEWIEFHTGLDLPWSNLNVGFDRLEVITEEAFQDFVAREAAGGNPGNGHVGEFVMRSGRRVHVAFGTSGGTDVDLHVILGHLTEGGGFHATDPAAGTHLLINPNNLSRWNVHPTSRKPLPRQYAWPASFRSSR